MLHGFSSLFILVFNFFLFIAKFWILTQMVIFKDDVVFENNNNNKKKMCRKQSSKIRLFKKVWTKIG